MRLVPLLALALLALPGCEDAVGLVGGCSARMREVRRAEGRQPDDVTPREERGGDYTEQWIYRPTSTEAGRVYTFRWGVSYASCAVTGPVPLAVLPGDAGIDPASSPADR
jgi:hypothetical protein